MQDQELMDYFKFDEADLEANRSGEYSEAQKKRLFKSLFAPKKYFFYKVQAPISIEGEKWDYHAAAEVHYVLYVGKKGFVLNQNLLNIMTRGDVYAVDWCSDIESPQDSWMSRDKILSVELISKASNAARESGGPGSHQKRLEELKSMRAANLITEQEFEQKKKEILEQL